MPERLPPVFSPDSTPLRQAPVRLPAPRREVAEAQSMAPRLPGRRLFTPLRRDVASCPPAWLPPPFFATPCFVIARHARFHAIRHICAAYSDATPAPAASVATDFRQADKAAADDTMPRATRPPSPDKAAISCVIRAVAFGVLPIIDLLRLRCSRRLTRHRAATVTRLPS